MIREGLDGVLSSRPVHSFALHYLQKLIFFSAFHAMRLPLSNDLLVLAFRDWRLPGYRFGPRPRTTFYPRRPFRPHAPDAVCVRDALGKPGLETDPSFFRRVELVPGSLHGQFPQSQLSVIFHLRVVLLLRKLRSGFHSLLATQAQRIVQLVLPGRYLRTAWRHAAFQISPQRHQ
jgi:hypothetical protein